MAGLLRRVQQGQGSVLRKKIWCAGVAALVYNIWRMRNMYIWANEDIDNNRLLAQVKRCIKNRIGLMYRKALSCEDEAWFYSL